MKLTRRGFLQTSALAGVTAIGLVGCEFEEEPIYDAIKEDRAPKPVGKLAEGKWVGSGCTGCTSWCSTEAYVVNGRIVKVRGNANSKTNKKNSCPRLHLGIQQMYDPDRIKQPMKRTNSKKGRNEDPGFVPITWEEALNTIADKHAELINNGESHKFALLRGRYTNSNELSYGRMVGILGSPNNISHSSICAEAEKFGPMYTEGFGSYRDYDLDNTKFVLCWGMDPLSSNRQVSNWLNKWGDVLDRATVAVVEPRLTSTASKAHEWLPVKSGYDAPIALAIAHVALTEGLWYKEFVGDFKDGVNQFIAGKTVSEDSFEEKETYGIVKWWNLELKDRTPQWAANLSGVPAEQIIRVARGMGVAAPAVCVMMGGGAVMQQRGGYTSMAIHALAGIFGASDNIGGSTQNPSTAHQGLPKNDDFKLKSKTSQKIDQRGYLQWPNMPTGKVAGGVNTNNVADAILTEDPYDIKMIYAYWCNFNFSAPETDRWDK
ncbi:MAG: molybdopterin-dependent oxidoreductase, partial [Bacillota bacterium]|nr:molybdopterin-dependent oxidoreductase [Bacillota bacterium]